MNTISSLERTNKSQVLQLNQKKLSKPISWKPSHGSGALLWCAISSMSSYQGGPFFGVLHSNGSWYIQFKKFCPLMNSKWINTKWMAPITSDWPCPFSFSVSTLFIISIFPIYCSWGAASSTNYKTSNKCVALFYQTAIQHTDWNSPCKDGFHVKREIALRWTVICYNSVSADQAHPGPTDNRILHHRLLNNAAWSLWYRQKMIVGDVRWESSTNVFFNWLLGGRLRFLLGKAHHFL